MTHTILLLGLEMEEPLKKNEGNFREKVVDYLKSDTYLYAPLGDTKSSDHFAAKNVISPRKGRVTLFPKVLYSCCSLMFCARYSDELELSMV